LVWFCYFLVDVKIKRVHVIGLYLTPFNPMSRYCRGLGIVAHHQLKAGMIISGLIVTITQTLSAQSIEVEFGNLYGADHHSNPTTVISGTGALGAALENKSFYWVCLDVGLPSSDLNTLTYSVSTDVASLSGGLWSSDLTDSVTRESIIQGITNMYYMYQESILEDTLGDGGNDTAGTGFQVAIWYITRGYQEGIWSGTLDSVAIGALKGWTENEFISPTTGWVSDMLNATQVNQDQDQIFLASYSSNEYQPVALLPYSPITIPEPGAMILLSGAGALTLFRRRRDVGQC
jgi:hypothetical protein